MTGIKKVLFNILLIQPVILLVIFKDLIELFGKYRNFGLLSDAFQLISPCNDLYLREKTPDLIQQGIICAIKDYRINIFKKKLPALSLKHIKS